MTAALMAAMMLPGAIPAVTARSLRAAALFAASYFAVWVVVGLALELWPDNSFVVAGVVTIAAGLYELTPFKRECRRRCREDARSGFDFGLWCVGSSIGLMVIFAALGVMSVGWMLLIAAVVVGQKLVAPKPALDIALALAIVALGIVVAVEPSLVPGLDVMTKEM